MHSVKYQWDTTLGSRYSDEVFLDRYNANIFEKVFQDRYKVIYQEEQNKFKIELQDFDIPQKLSNHCVVGCNGYRYGACNVSNWVCNYGRKTFDKYPCQIRFYMFRTGQVPCYQDSKRHCCEVHELWGTEISYISDHHLRVNIPRGCFHRYLLIKYGILDWLVKFHKFMSLES